MCVKCKGASVLLLSMFLGLTAFGQAPPRVVATASMIADMVEQIAGDLVDLTCIVPIGGDPHLYEPTPKDARTVAEADLLFKNGLTFEGWLNELIENAGSEAQVVTVTQGVQPIESLVYQNATDPHAWMDAENGLIYAQNIMKSLMAYDTNNAEIYQANYDAYSAELRETHRYIQKQIETIPPERRILITSHDAFQYYGRKYGLRLESVLGTSTDADVQTADIIRLNDVIRKNKVPAVFVESTINPKILEQLARDNDIIVGGKLYADSIGDKNSPAPTYTKMLIHNTDVIVHALIAESGNSSSESQKGSGSSPLLYILLAVVLILVFFLLVRKFSIV